MKFFYYSLLFLTSFVYMGFEMVASRLMTPYFGSTVYTWGAIISIFLLGSTLGYWIGGRNADRPRAAFFLIAYFVAGALMIAFIPFAAAKLLPLLQNLPEPSNILLASFILFLLPNLALSAITPAVIKESLSARFSGRNIGLLHAVSAIGSIAGTMITTFFMIPNMDHHYIFAIFALVLVLGIIGLLRTFTWTKALTMLLLIVICLFPLSPRVDENWLPGSKLIYRDASLYHDLYVVESDELFGEYGEYRMLLFGHGGVQGAIDTSDPDRIAMQYIRNMLNLVDVNKPDFQQGFFIGHGVGSASRYYQNKDKQIITAEIDEKVLEISKEYFGYKGEGVHIGDGRKMLEQEADRSQDIIVMDAFSDESIPFHLTTQQFFELTARKLKADGLLVMNIVGRIHNDEVLNAIYTTIGSIYPFTRVYATDPDDVNDQNVFVIAGFQEIPEHNYPECTEITLESGEIITDTNTKFNLLN